MNAIVQTGYGSADVMKLKQVEKPTPGDGEVLLRVLAASLAAGNYFGMRGKPFPVRMYTGFPKPKPDFIVGLDFAGVVEAVGKDVTRAVSGTRRHANHELGKREARGACALLRTHGKSIHGHQTQRSHISRNHPVPRLPGVHPSRPPTKGMHDPEVLITLIRRRGRW